MNDLIENYNLNKFKLLQLYSKNKKLVKSIIAYLYLSFNKVIIIKPKIIDLLSFVPLPTYFKTKNHLLNSSDDIFMNENNTYSFLGEPGNRIIIGNICLPFPTFSPIPFSFVYKYNDKPKTIISNVYYYEIKIDNEPFREPWEKQAISLGFGPVNTNIKNNHVGWSSSCVGYHSDDGIIYYNNAQQYRYFPYTYGDIVGAGIIYIKNCIYKIFFTLNGNLLPYMCDLITINKLTPMMGIDFPAGIHVNFGNKDFAYDFTEHITPIVISTKNHFIEENFSLKKYEYKTNLLGLNIKSNTVIKYSTLEHLNTTEYDTIEEEPINIDIISPNLTAPIVNTYIENMTQTTNQIINQMNNDVDYIISNFNI